MGMVIGLQAAFGLSLYRSEVFEVTRYRLGGHKISLPLCIRQERLDLNTEMNSDLQM